MLRTLLVVAGLELLLGACGDEESRGAPPAVELPPRNSLMAFTGTADEYGHVMLPAGSPGTCEVHQLPLADDVIAVLCGLPYIDTSGYSEVQPVQFPHDASLFYGGCS